MQTGYTNTNISNDNITSQRKDSNDIGVGMNNRVTYTRTSLTESDLSERNYNPSNIPKNQNNLNKYNTATRNNKMHENSIEISNENFNKNHKKHMNILTDDEEENETLRLEKKYKKQKQNYVQITTNNPTELNSQTSYMGSNKKRENKNINIEDNLDKYMPEKYIPSLIGNDTLQSQNNQNEGQMNGDNVINTEDNLKENNPSNVGITDNEGHEGNTLSNRNMMYEFGNTSTKYDAYDLPFSGIYPKHLQNNSSSNNIPDYVKKINKRLNNVENEVSFLKDQISDINMKINSLMEIVNTNNNNYNYVIEECHQLMESKVNNLMVNNDNYLKMITKEIQSNPNTYKHSQSRSNINQGMSLNSSFNSNKTPGIYSPNKYASEAFTSENRLRTKKSHHTMEILNTKLEEKFTDFSKQLEDKIYSSVLQPALMQLESKLKSSLSEVKIQLNQAELRKYEERSTHTANTHSRHISHHHHKSKEIPIDYKETKEEKEGNETQFHKRKYSIGDNKKLKEHVMKLEELTNKFQNKLKEEYPSKEEFKREFSNNPSNTDINHHKHKHKDSRISNKSKKNNKRTEYTEGRINMKKNNTGDIED